MRDYLPDYDREAFVTGLTRRRTGSQEELGRKAGVSSLTLRRWFAGGQVRRSSADRVRTRLGMRAARSTGLGKLASDLRSVTSPGQARTLLCSAAVMLAEASGCKTPILQIGNHPRLCLGTSEVILGRIRGEPCYRIMDEGLLCFEGTLSHKAAGMLKEFLAWRDARDKETADLRQKVQKQYDRF